MESSDQPNSILHINQLQMYPVPTSTTSTNPPPFPLLCGEGVVHQAHSVYGTLVLTNFRFFVQLCDSQHHVPLGLLEVIEHRDLFFLHISCKDARTYRLTFDNNEACLDWYSRLLKASSPPGHLEELFGFFYFVWSKQERPQSEIAAKLELQRLLLDDEKNFNDEVERLQFNLHGTWRISSINKNYKLCGSYPPNLLVPAYITDEVLETVAKFRSSRRIPAVVWRHVGNGAVIARCSQPEVGWLGWRSAEDEDLIKAISEACTQDRGPHAMYTSHSPSSVNSSTEESTHIRADIETTEKKKVLIIDARSYTTAVANRARGGGCECPEYYPSCEIQFMNLPNIHAIRKSFHALRHLCTSTADQPYWFSTLENTRWLQHMSGLMRSAVTVVTAVERDARPVLVHCSDGWDRTPQLVALAELLLDPYYRTIDGFRILVEREWLSFGHKFADRCGQSTGSDDINERCPVFLQWLDCVHQLLLQFPCAFEFSHAYLVKLAQHTYSNLFGTFLCNTKQERESFYDTTFSVWLFLNTPAFKNHLYSSNKTQILWPQFNVRDLVLWSEVYLGSLEKQSGGGSAAIAEVTNGNVPIADTAAQQQQQLQQQQQQHMTKTRSYGDLLHASEGSAGYVRRSSDPNIAVETKKLAAVTLKDEEKVVNGGRTTPTNGNFLCEMDENDCKSDCIYKNVMNGGEAVDELNEPVLKVPDLPPVSTPHLVDHVIEKTEETEVFENHNKDFFDGFTRCSSKEVPSVTAVPSETPTLPTNDLMYSVCLEKSVSNGVDGPPSVADSESEECTEPSEVSVVTVSLPTNETEHDVKRLETSSVETSTETLVSETISSSSPREYNGFEKLSNTDVFYRDDETCKVCAHIKTIPGKHSQQQLLALKTAGAIAGGTATVTPTPPPPPYSRTPSTNGWESSFTYYSSDLGPPKCRNTVLDDDGLVPLHSDVQERLGQIIEDHKKKCEMLQRELHLHRQALIKQVCHRCNHDGDKNDETCTVSSCEIATEISSRVSSPSPPPSSPSPRRSHTPNRLPIAPVVVGSVVESVCSAGEGQTSAVESLRSDMSWENVDEGASSLLEGVPTLWVPDHAVSRCTGCGTEFWLGRRKHHCRNCGRIFCADCSENSTPLPSEQLYDPVRVCTSCYSKLRRHTNGVPINGDELVQGDVYERQCKASAGTSTGNQPQQIAASSN